MVTRELEIEAKEELLKEKKDCIKKYLRDAIINIDDREINLKKMKKDYSDVLSIDDIEEAYIKVRSILIGRC